MTLFTNGYVSFQIPKGFQTINNNEEFVELVLVDSKKPMTIKVSITPILFGLVDIKDDIEKNLENGNAKLLFSDFIPINDDIYYSSVVVDDKESARCNSFFFVKDDNLYTFEFVYPYADAVLDDFYLNIIRSLKIGKAKYIVEKNSYKINEN